jgi:hypothetical protein
VIVGEDGEMPWEAYKRCLLDPPDSEWLLIIQDDATPAAAIAETVGPALDGQTGPVALFLPTTSLNNVPLFWQAQIKHETHVRLLTSDFVPVVALCWPTRLIDGFLAWATDAGYDHARRRAEDAIVGEWATRKAVTVVATVPSLVEHDDRVESIWKTRSSNGPPRMAVAVADL